MATPLNIRNPEARVLAKRLASLRNVSITDAVVGALKADIKRLQAGLPLAARLEALADRTLAKAAPGRDIGEDERDSLWTR